MNWHLARLAQSLVLVTGRYWRSLSIANSQISADVRTGQTEGRFGVVKWRVFEVNFQLLKKSLTVVNICCVTKLKCLEELLV
jgi:hypothetical protein